MKLKAPTQRIKTSDGFAEREYEYGISQKDIGFILEILRSKIYKNPIASICREIPSNARDAHREIRNKEPISIMIKESSMSGSQMEYIVEDRGVGISPDRIADVFIKYGSSTKRDTNTQTGGFGLGAKCPFSYTDTFTIITVYDKVEYTYITAIENGREGKLLLVDQENVDRCNGTQIIIPIEMKDRYNFETETLLATAFWDVPPKYVNFNRKMEWSEFYTHESVRIVTEESSNVLSSGYHLLLDGIIYNLDIKLLKLNKLFKEYISFKNPILLKFKTGELTISATRESVQYDKPTIERISQKINGFMDHIKEYIEETIKKQPTKLHASMIMQPIIDSFRFAYDKNIFKHGELLHLVDKNQIDVKYNGENLLFRTSNFYGFTFILYSTKKKKPEELLTFDSRFVTLPVIFMDEARMHKEKNYTLYLEGNGEFIIFSISKKFSFVKNFSTLPYADKRKRAGEVRKVLTQYKDLKTFGVNFKQYSSIVKTKIPKDGFVERNIYSYKHVPCRTINGIQHYSETLHVYPHKILYRSQKPVENTITYFHEVDTIEGFVLSGNSCWDENLVSDPFLIAAGSVGYEIIIVSNRYVKNLYGWVRPISMIKNDRRVQRRLQYIAAIKYVGSKDDNDLFKNFLYMNEVLPLRERRICGIIELLQNKEYAYRKVDTPKEKVSKFIVGIVTYVENFMKKYPLLEFIKITHRYDKDEIKEFKKQIKGYIDLIKFKEECKDGKKPKVEKVKNNGDCQVLQTTIWEGRKNISSNV